MKVAALLQEPSLDGEFPLEFRNGLRIATLGFWCRSCKAAIPLTAVHGNLARMLEKVADITAAAPCGCGEVNHYRIRLHDDATCSYLKKGVWVRERTGIREKPSTLNRIKLQILFLSIRWKCYRLTRALKTMQRDFRHKHGLHHDS